MRQAVPRFWYKGDAGRIFFVPFIHFLNALQARNAKFLSCFDHLIEKMADHFMARGRDADFLALPD